ncbi:uncharacterized protein LOC141537399 isoform X3 [Cotesia typhae]|uniref:uncharacterized protein LOC141537399 isoform X3 n=1 Tax=Cotesia typhae TaxID=2053667 RepID=UPI003D69E549
MNVPLAYQLFSKDIQVAMKVYKNNTEELRDCDSTIAFIEKVNNLIQAMSSRTPAVFCAIIYRKLQFLNGYSLSTLKIQYLCT